MRRRHAKKENKVAKPLASGKPQALAAWSAPTKGLGESDPGVVGQIECEFDRLGGAISELERAAKILIDRLAPVSLLRVAEPKPPTAEISKALCPVAARLESASLSIEEARESLQYAESCLEI
jgi:hypothetical protein